jgi:hypothetical protein
LPCLALPCLALPCLALPYLTLPYLALPRLASPCLTLLLHSTLPCLALPSFTLPYLALPHPPLLYLTLPHQRVLRKIAREKANRKFLDGSITQSMVAWQQRMDVEESSGALRSTSQAKGTYLLVASLVILSYKALPVLSSSLFSSQKS